MITHSWKCCLVLLVLGYFRLWQVFPQITWGSSFFTSCQNLFLEVPVPRAISFSLAEREAAIAFLSVTAFGQEGSLLCAHGFRVWNDTDFIQVL